MNRPIRKAIFPVAGLGTRFLPATKAMPKEMLTVVDKPLIQIVVEEAREAGIEHFIFVTGRNKGVIEDHFDNQYELEATLKQRGEVDAFHLLQRDMPGAGQTSFTRQQQPLGLGHAIWCARNIVGDEPFAVLLPDMLTKSPFAGCMKQMVKVYEQRNGGNVVAVQEVHWEQVHRYGVVGAKDWSENQFSISSMIEKPNRKSAVSNLIISGRYILQPQIFWEIEQLRPGVGGEIQITDAMIRLMETQPFHGLKFDGENFDCGDRVGFLAANVAFALDRLDIGQNFRSALQQAVSSHGGKITWDDTADN